MNICVQIFSEPVKDFIQGSGLVDLNLKKNSTDWFGRGWVWEKLEQRQGELWGSCCNNPGKAHWNLNSVLCELE